ncbi:hypothetical protein BDB01DRAFT_728709 [Pilobolus umbonatus]|nr:hypothetical protein BDB01DRAFT_728709 [Pilobolus umbonatus]
MRYAISGVASGQYEQSLLICSLLRKLETEFEILAAAHLYQLSKKMGALKSSIKKVEQACYTFQIRGSEYPKEVYMQIIKDHQDKYEQNVQCIYE